MVVRNYRDLRVQAGSGYSGAEQRCASEMASHDLVPPVCWSTVPLAAAVLKLRVCKVCLGAFDRPPTQTHITGLLMTVLFSLFGALLVVLPLQHRLGANVDRATSSFPD